MILLCSGGRSYGIVPEGGGKVETWRARLERAIVHQVLREINPSIVIVGDATGADYWVRVACGHLGIPCRQFFADWKTLNKAAGPERNMRMVKQGKPDFAVLFPGGPGTANMESLLLKFNIPHAKVSTVNVTLGNNPVHGG